MILHIIRLYHLNPPSASWTSSSGNRVVRTKVLTQFREALRADITSPQALKTARLYHSLRLEINCFLERFLEYF